MVEVIKEVIPETVEVKTKECICPRCGSLLRVAGTDLDPSLSHYLCPICGSTNEWLSPEEEKILALVKKSLDLYSDLNKYYIPKRK